MPHPITLRNVARSQNKTEKIEEFGGEEGEGINDKTVLYPQKNFKKNIPVVDHQWLCFSDFSFPCFLPNFLRIIFLVIKEP